MEEFGMSKNLAHRYGGFADCAVVGDWYERQDGTRFWQMTVVSADNYRSGPERINLHCLVSDHDFQCFNVGITFPDLEVAICEGPVDIDPLVRKGVLDTIGTWEGEAQFHGA
jgi:hypothetical protein